MDDFVKTLVFWEFAVNSFEIKFVILENLLEAFHTEDFPPSISLHDTEDSSQDVSDITATSNVRGKGTIRYGDQNGSSVIKDDVHILHGLDGVLNDLRVFSNLCSNICPGLVDIVYLINVESAGVWSELLPDL